VDLKNVEVGKAMPIPVKQGTRISSACVVLADWLEEEESEEEETDDEEEEEEVKPKAAIPKPPGSEVCHLRTGIGPADRTVKRVRNR
jgi:hypothetical protein